MPVLLQQLFSYVIELLYGPSNRIVIIVMCVCVRILNTYLFVVYIWGFSVIFDRITIDPILAFGGIKEKAVMFVGVLWVAQ